MAEPIFVAQPGGGQVAVSGLSPQNVADIARRMSQQAETRGTPTPPPSPTSALGQVTAMANATGGSTAAITGAPSRQTAADLQGRIQAASKPFVPELIAGYRDASGTYVPPSFTRPAAGQTIPSTLQTATGEFDPALIEQDPRYRLLAEQRKLLEERKATAGQDVEAAFVAREAALRGQQAAQAGEASMQLARMGALGTTVSGMSYLQNMDRRHLQESYDLGLQKAREIEKAKQLLENQQFDLVEQQLNIADQIQQNFETARSKQIDNLMKTRQLQKYERDTAQETLATLASAGINESDLPDDYLNFLDDQQALPRGTSSRIFQLAQKEQETKQIQDQIKLRDQSLNQAKELVSLLSKTQEGGTVNIDGFDYTVTGNTDALQSGLQIDEQGMGIAYTYNKITGQYSIQNLGKIGANKDQWKNVQTNRGTMRQNVRTGEILPLETSTNYAQAQIPDGIVWGASVGRANAGQCGAFVNDLTGLGVGDTWESKQSKTDSTIGTSRNPIQIGDVIVQKMGTTGHVAIINEMKEVPIDPLNPNSPAKLMLRLSESNMVPPNGRVTSSTRWIDANDSSITGIARGSRKPFVSGTDASPEAEGLIVYTPEELTAQRQMAAEQRAEQRAIAREERAAVREQQKQVRAAETRPQPLEVYSEELMKPLSSKEIESYGLDPRDPANIGLNTVQVKERIQNLQAIEAKNYQEFATKFRRDATLVGGGMIFEPTEEQIRNAYKLSKETIAPTAPTVTARPTTRAGISDEEATQIAESIFRGTSSLKINQLPESQRVAVDRKLSALRQQAMQSGDLIGNMRSTAGSGNNMVAKEREDLGRVIGVIGQVEDLISALKTTKTDPILGALRTANPYDVKAREISARLTSISPGLARGVYGEVGVLTNADIERYQATLPNLKSTKEQNKAVTLMTLRTLQRTLESNFQSFANNKIDVSEWVPTFQSLKNKTDRLEADLIGRKDPTSGQLYVVGKDNNLYLLPLNEFSTDEYRLATQDELKRANLRSK